MVYYTYFPSPVRSLMVWSDGNAIRGLRIAGDRRFGQVESGWQELASCEVLQWVGQELAEYFAGQRLRFTVPIALEGTEFQRQVWQAVGQISYGSTMSYQQVATKLGRPRAARAVGTADGQNSICILIPCHRVVGSDGSVAGYAAGVECKRWLLELENGE